jgi:hypothetical protein
MTGIFWVYDKILHNTNECLLNRIYLLSNTQDKCYPSQNQEDIPNQLSGILEASYEKEILSVFLP